MLESLITNDTDTSTEENIPAVAEMQAYDDIQHAKLELPREVRSLPGLPAQDNESNKSAQSNLGTGPRRGSCARRWLA